MGRIFRVLSNFAGQVVQHDGRIYVYSAPGSKRTVNSGVAEPRSVLF